jgi:hypothetical protein
MLSQALTTAYAGFSPQVMILPSRSWTLSTPKKWSLMALTRLRFAEARGKWLLDGFY